MLLASAAIAAASDVTLRTTLNTWSKKIGADARSVALAAQRRHPSRMTSSAKRFQRDALHARAAVVAQTPSTAKGQQARRLAVTAFAAYARAGGKWALCGQARVKHQRAAAARFAASAAVDARTGNKLLVGAGKLIR